MHRPLSPRAVSVLLPAVLFAAGCASAKRSPKTPAESYRRGGDRAIRTASTGSTRSEAPPASPKDDSATLDRTATREPSPSSAPAGARPGPALARRDPPRGGQPRGGAKNTTPGERKAAVAHGAQVSGRRMIIYKAHLKLRVLEAEEAMAQAQRIALENGGYLQSRRNRRIVFRVPVGRFHALLAKFEALGEVASRRVNARDVTQRYSDIKVRLEAAKAVLERLKALLAKAKNVQESLAIERQMARVIVKIERFKGQLKYLRHHASLSTISLYFRTRRRHHRRVKSSWKNPFGWVKRLGLWRTLQF